MPRESGASSKLRLLGSLICALEYWIIRFRGWWRLRDVVDSRV